MNNKLRHTSTNIAEIVIVVIILVAVSLVGYKFFHRFDMTENKQFTISDATKEVLQGMDDPINAEFFLSSDLPPQFVRIKDDVRDKLDEYVAFGRGHFKLKVTDPGDDLDEKDRALKLGVPELEINVTEKDAITVKKVYFGLVLSFEDRTETIRTDELADPSNLEYALTSRLVKLTQEKKPKLGLFIGPFLQGQQQQGPQYETLKQLLGGAQGMYEIVTVDPQANRTLPEDLDGLIIAGAFGMPDSLKYSIDQFIMNGGQVLVMIDPMMQPQQQSGSMQQAFPSLPTIEEQLEKYGVKLNKQLVVDPSCGQAPMSGGLFTIIRDYYLWPKVLPGGFNQEVSAVAQLEDLVLPWCCPLQGTNIEGVKFSPLASSTDKSFTLSSPFNLEPDQDWPYLESSAPAKGPFTLVAMLEGNLPTAYPGGPPNPVEPPAAAGEETEPVSLKPQFDAGSQVMNSEGQGRIVVMTSALGLSDGFVDQFRQNLLFLVNTMDMMLLGDELMGIRSTPVTARPLKTGLDEKQKSFYRWINVLGVPILLVLLGLLLWFLKGQRRRAIARYYEDFRG
ncbi:GldG family protein [bacterium]|nr:GldG family protein [bacterium]